MGRISGTAKGQSIFSAVPCRCLFSFIVCCSISYSTGRLKKKKPSIRLTSSQPSIPNSLSFASNSCAVFSYCFVVIVMLAAIVITLYSYFFIQNTSTNSDLSHHFSEKSIAQDHELIYIISAHRQSCSLCHTVVLLPVAPRYMGRPDGKRKILSPPTGEGIFLTANQILYCVFQILHFAQQPEGQLRQPEGAYEKRDYQ